MNLVYRMFIHKCSFEESITRQKGQLSCDIGQGTVTTQPVESSGPKMDH